MTRRKEAYVMSFVYNNLLANNC